MLGSACAQVETGSEGSTPRTPHARRSAAAAENGGGGGAPRPELSAAQLSDWRLRAALASRQDFQVRCWHKRRFSPSFCGGVWEGSLQMLLSPCFVLLFLFALS